MRGIQVRFLKLCVSWWRHQWKHFPRNWPFEREIHRSIVQSPHKGQWRVALMFPLIWAWTNGWENKQDAGDLRRHCAHYGVTVKCVCVHVCLCLQRYKPTTCITVISHDTHVMLLLCYINFSLVALHCVIYSDSGHSHVIVIAELHLLEGHVYKKKVSG